MKKRIFRSLTVTITVILVAILLYINYIAHGITGYAAKNVASGIFVAGRTQKSIEKTAQNLQRLTQVSKEMFTFENPTSLLYVY